MPVLDAYDPGTLIAGRYRLEALRASGGLAAVFKACDTASGAACAVKVLFEARPGRARALRREAELTDAVRNDHVVRVRDVGDLPDGRAFLVTEWLEGRSALELLQEGPIHWRHALEVTRAIACALSETHAMGILHRDVKSKNIMLPGVSAVPQCRAATLIDFGIARRLSQPDTGAPMAHARVSGTLEYMAPEQIAGRWESEATDVYGLGSACFEMLLGRPPMGYAGTIVRAEFPHSTAASVLVGPFVTRRLTEQTTIPSEVPGPAELRVLLDRMLRRDPRERFQSAAEVLAGCDTALAVSG